MTRSERLIDELQIGGWNQLSGVAAQHRGDGDNQTRRIRAEQQLLHEVFSRPDGRRVLDLLVALTIDKPAWRWDIVEPQAVMAYGLHAEGQKSVVQMILDAVAEVDAAMKEGRRDVDDEI